MAKYIAVIAGRLKEVLGLSVSTGPADANKIIETGPDGKMDLSLLPPGVGPEVQVMPASENLAAGDFVNIFDNAGTTNARKADATTSAKPAKGFVLAAVTAPANATVYLLSQQNNGLSGLTLGADYYLSTTAGLATTAAPSGAGNIVQRLGTALNATTLVFENTTTIELA